MTGDDYEIYSLMLGVTVPQGTLNIGKTEEHEDWVTETDWNAGNWYGAPIAAL